MTAVRFPSRARKPLDRTGATRSALARVWLVARAIRERRERVTASTLGKELEVNPKTILRDVEFLRDRFQHDIVYDESAFTWRYNSIPMHTYL